ncbi:MAG: hypothetical protein K0R14_1068 [Burkholderiales bacterium]|jgi:hypothetical protein|nr:hypothetical protein [Burkholderiales bacterium]
MGLFEMSTNTQNSGVNSINATDSKLDNVGNIHITMINCIKESASDFSELYKDVDITGPLISVLPHLIQGDHY